MIADWTKRHTKHEAMEIIGAAGVPAGAVLDTMELYNDQTFEQRGIFQTDRAPGERHVQDAGMAGAVRRPPAAGDGHRRCSARTTNRCSAIGWAWIATRSAG